MGSIWKNIKKVFIGIPILNRLDLLIRCIGALDYPSDVIIVNNNSSDNEFNYQLNSLTHQRGLQVLHQKRNLGVAASWNLIIRSGIARGYEWIFIGSNDTFLTPGSLKKAVEVRKDATVGVWHLHAFNFFLLRKMTIDLVGWFDKNFYPAYKEDQDYSYRCWLAGVNRLPSIPGCGAEHIGSATIKSDRHFRNCNQRTHSRNTDYYRLKWGGDANQEVFTRPFNQPDYKWWQEANANIGVRDWTE